MNKMTISNRTTPSLRAIFVLFCAAAVLGYAGWLFSLLLTLPTDGCGGVYVTNGVSINQLGLGDTSLQTGDLLTGINGQEIYDGLFTPGHWSGRLFDAASRSNAYAVLRDDRKLTVEVVWQTPSFKWLFARSSIFVILGIIFVSSGAFIVWQRGHDRAARLMAVAFIAEGLNLFNNTVLVTGLNTGLAVAWFSTPIDILSLCLVFSALFHCFALFPEAKWLGRRFPRLLYLVHLINPLVGIGGGVLFGGHTQLGVRSAMLASTYAIAGVELLVTIGHTVHTYLTTRQAGVRNQIRWLIWGLAVGTTPWLLFYNVAFIVVGKPLLPLGAVLVPLILIPIALIFSIARYGLMAIDTLINRSLVYGVLTLVLVTVNLGVATFLSDAWSKAGGESGETVIVIISTLVAVLTFSAVRKWLQGWIDRIFFRGRLNFENLLREMGERLTTTLVFDNLATLLTEYIPTRLELTGAFLFTVQPAQSGFAAHPPIPFSLEQCHPFIQQLRQAGNPVVISQFRPGAPALTPAIDALSQTGIEVCLPLRRAEKLIGVYALGHKKSGDLYDDRELDILILLGHQISAALENTRLYREIEEYNRTLESQVEARTRALRAANKKLADTAWDLAEQRARLDAILQNIADGLVVTDPDDKIVLSNAVFDKIVGIGGNKLRGRPLTEIFPGPELTDVVLQARRQLDYSFSAEVTVASDRVYKASACALTQAGTLIGVTTVLRDITHEVEVDRMKTDFISTVSHELRTPLTSVLGFAKLIRRSFRSVIAPHIQTDDRKVRRAVDRVDKNLEIIESESQRLTRLINDVLDIAKMEAGKIEWRLVPVRMQEIVETSVTATSALLAGKPIDVSVDLEPELPVVIADFDRMIQVVANLLSNAIKFTEQGAISVRTWLLNPGEEIEAQGTRAEDTVTGLPTSVPVLAISITDTGIGIQPDDLTQVFARFKQVGDVLTGRPRGTGLGLPICREIVEYHGGRIWVESTPGQGSRFIFTLPVERELEIAERPAAAPALETKPEMAGPLALLSSDGLAHLRVNRVDEIRQRISENLPQDQAEPSTILIVDDEPNIRLLLDQELTDAGYRVIEAADGLVAVEMARSQQPDLILLDVMMPGLSGFDVTSVLKADEQTKHIPILILSIIEDRERGFRLGADDYLTKPVRTEQLLDAVSGLLYGSMAERRALVVHQDESVVEAITRVLRERGFQVTAAYDPRGAIEKAQEIQPNLVVLNAILSQLDDYKVLKALNYTHFANQMDILVLAGSEDDPPTV